MAKACKKSSKHISESESETENLYWNRKKLHTEFQQKNNAKIIDENLEKKEVDLIQNINKEENVTTSLRSI